MVRALETWPRDGVPDNPRGWLLVTAKRRAVDLIRREARRAGKEAEAIMFADPSPAPPSLPRWSGRPAPAGVHLLPPGAGLEAQVALALRTLGGLSTAEVARALLVPEATMAKRLTRAKQKIAQARIPYRVPAAEELPGPAGRGRRHRLPDLQRGIRRRGGRGPGPGHADRGGDPAGPRCWPG